MGYTGGYPAGMSSFRRTAFVGPKILLDVVDDISRNGRVAFLTESKIDLKKGKAFDAWLHRPRRFGDHTWDGPTGGWSPGGTGGRLAFMGIGSKPVVLCGITKRRITFANIYNTY